MQANAAFSSWTTAKILTGRIVMIKIYGNVNAALLVSTELSFFSQTFDPLQLTSRQNGFPPRI